MNLLALQREMAQDVMRPRGAAARDAAYLVSRGQLTSRDRLGIYHRQYWQRLTDALAEDFPGLLGIVGKRAFARLSAAYLRDCPSQSFTLRDLGSRLPEWLVCAPRGEVPNAGAACDMARFEWALVEAFDAAELREIGPEDLAEPDPNLKMILQPHIRLLRLTFAVDQMRERVASGGRIPRIQGASDIRLAVYRKDGEVCHRRVEPAEYATLECFTRGGGLSRLLSRSLRSRSLPAAEFQSNISRWLASWMERGWLAKLEKRPRP